MDIKSEFKSIIKLDKRLSDRVRLENLPGSIRKISELLAHSGDVRFWWPVLIVLWLFGNIFWKQWAVTIVMGLLLLGIIMLPIKKLVKRKRPLGLWGRKTRQKDPQSFPSGHAARTFLLAVLTTGLGPAWLAVIFWIWAPWVSLSRVAMGVHYLSDVLGGFLIAVGVALLWLYVHAGVLQLLMRFFLQVLHLPLW
jgi:undecaprenyl-diphosphatase